MEVPRFPPPLGHLLPWARAKPVAHRFSGGVFPSVYSVSQIPSGSCSLSAALSHREGADIHPLCGRNHYGNDKNYPASGIFMVLPNRSWAISAWGAVLLS